MPARAEVEASVALLTVNAGSSTWAIPSAAVASIEPFDSASSEKAVDVLELLGVAAPTTTHATRVLVLQVSGQRLRLLARGALLLRNAGERELLPLPATFAASAPLVTHIAVVDGKPALFVVSPERLLHVLHATDGSPSPTLPNLPEARPC